VSSVLAGISPILDDQALYERLQKQDRTWEGSRYLLDLRMHHDSAAHDTTDSDSDEEDDEQVLDDLFESVTSGDIDSACRKVKRNRCSSPV
jgi:hypothetical protein